MTFGEQVVATMIGSIAGFIFSLCLFYLKEKWAKSATKKFLEKNVITELDYNIMLLSKVKDGIQKCIEKVTVGDKDIYCQMNYSRFGRFFIQAYYQNGFIFNHWKTEDIDKLDAMLITFTENTDRYILRTMKDYRVGNIDDKQALTTFSHERGLLEDNIKYLHTLKGKLIQATSTS